MVSLPAIGNGLCDMVIDELSTGCMHPCQCQATRQRTGTRGSPALHVDISAGDRHVSASLTRPMYLMKGDAQVADLDDGMYPLILHQADQQVCPCFPCPVSVQSSLPD